MLLLALLACRTDGPSPAGSDTSAPTLDLTERLPSGVARAGVVTDEAALFGGVSAEGRAGDVKIYNDRVQFVIQGLRDSSYYLSEGGTVIDADIVRPVGVPGRDIVDEWAPMIGIGRVMSPVEVEVLADGADGGPAIVRVSGPETGLGLFEGALEAPGLVTDLGLQIQTEYVLPPDSWLMEVRTTVTADDAATVSVADLLLGAPEVSRRFTDGLGMGDDAGQERRWTGYIADRNDVAAAIISPPGERWSSRGYELITALAEMAVAGSATTELAAGSEVTITRYYGVGPDLATLSDAALALRGDPAELREGVVTAPDGPVAGARVTALVDGAPVTVAVTDDDGAFSLQVPTDGAVVLRASGRATGRFLGLPPGAPSYAPYAAAPVRDEALGLLVTGAPAPALAEGRGVANESEPLTLGEPALLRILVDDGGPFTARVSFLSADPAVDERWVLPRPNGLAAAGWARDGELLLEVEPGTFRVVVHRGMRYEASEVELTLAAGEERSHVVSLDEAYTHDGWLLADPHQHASPSADGEITMEERLVVTAAVGLQLHFGTDHDHLADYRPLVDALSLSDVRSVVADEVSPPLRGHMNIYPVEPSDAANGGSFRWWTEVPETTEGLVDTLRARHGAGFILQSNHPTDSGVAAAAGWSPGLIDDASKWTQRFEAMEVMNAASLEDYPAVWWDLVLRGSAVVPVGVSDSHGHFGGTVGMSATWVHTGADLALYDDAQLTRAMRAGHLVVTRGPFLDVEPLPSTVAGGTTVTVQALSPSWITVDRLVLWRDGAPVETVNGTSATFTLAPEADAVYVVVAEGDQPMVPVTGHTPWAMTAPWRVDVDGDGFEPPLPPLTLQ
jgi:hypothetical protein